MKVTVREKRISNNRLRLFLDYYPAIINPTTGKATRRENLGLYIYSKEAYTEEEYQTNNGNRSVRALPILDRNGNPKTIKLTNTQQRHNKETLQQAEFIRSERQLQIQKKDYTFLLQDSTADFLSLFESRAMKVLANGNTNVKAAYNIFEKYCNYSCPMIKLTPDFCIGFQEYLKNYTPKFETKKGLANSSQRLYWGFFRSAINEAVEKKLILENPSNHIKLVKKVDEKQREFLTLDELKKAASAPCDMEELKRACLFSALTGLRHSDIVELKWMNITPNGENSYVVRKRIKKTKEASHIYISAETYKHLGNPKAPNERVFPKIKRSPWQDTIMRKWLGEAGITKYITFHCLRHTYATLQIAHGTDIYTVSKLLGHKSVSTTQIYARIIDEKKIEAAQKIVLN